MTAKPPACHCSSIQGILPLPTDSCRGRMQKRPRQKDLVRKVTRLRSSLVFASAAAQKEDSLPYEVVKPSNGQGTYELRLYQPRFIVEMPYKNRQTAYMEFDQYLTGKNEDGIHLKAFSPVVMRHEPRQGNKTMQMFVRSLGALPEEDLNLTQQPSAPKGNQLSLNIAGGEIVAVLQFGGQATRQASSQAADTLRHLLDKDGVSLSEKEREGLFSLAQYDPVHSLKERTNELWLAVSL